MVNVVMVMVMMIVMVMVNVNVVMVMGCIKRDFVFLDHTEHVSDGAGE